MQCLSYIKETNEWFKSLLPVPEYQQHYFKKGSYYELRFC